MARLAGRIAWVTGAGSGIGEAAALALAAEGAELVLSGRREAPLDAVAARIVAAGGRAHVEPGDMGDAAAAGAVAAAIAARFGRLHILVNNAGLNITERRWAALTHAGAEELLRGNLASAFHTVIAALPLMRPQRDGLLIHTASMAGRHVSLLSGAGYTAAKHGMVAMSHTLNMEEGVNGIRSSVICPGEVATPILDKRPNPVSPAERARMVQPQDVGELVRFIACLPSHVTLNEVWITPTWNRSHVAALGQNL